MSIAVPVYGAILGVSALVYYWTIQAMRTRIVTGAEGLLHEVGEVIDTMPKAVRIRIHSEIWDARSSERLRKGDVVRTIRFDGLTRLVEKVSRSNSGGWT